MARLSAKLIVRSCGGSIGVASRQRTLLDDSIDLRTFLLDRQFPLRLQGKTDNKFSDFKVCSPARWRLSSTSRSRLRHGGLSGSVELRNQAAVNTLVCKVVRDVSHGTVSAS
jgi:hypothetical protein